MNRFSFSDAQRDAVESRGEDLLVAAGAGSGKTTVLVARILSHIQAGGSLDRLLALTFTNAAAVDMRTRIDQALAAQIHAHPLDAHLRRQAALLPQAGIGTIHSFCLDLLRRYDYRLALPPGFRVAGELETQLLRNEVMDDLLEAEYAQPDSMLPALADAYGGSRDDRELTRLIFDLHAYSLSQPQPEQWLQRCAGAFQAQENLDHFPFSAFLDQYLAAACHTALRHARQALQLENGVPLLWRAQLQEEMELVAAAAEETEGLTQRLQRLAAVCFRNLRPTGKAKGDYNDAGEMINPYDDVAKDVFRSRRDAFRNEVKALQKRFVAGGPARQLADLEQLAPLMAELVRLTLAYGERLKAEKRRRGLIDFSDMEHDTLYLLSLEEVAAEIAGRYDEVLIDEYQDINEVQEAILQRLTAGGHLFAVGDVKQSIYRFRLAEPGLFLAKYDDFGEGRGGRRIDLNENYRSDRLVIAAINDMFRQLMRRETAEIAYDDAASLHAGRQTEGAAPELALLDLDQMPQQPGLLLEARWIARRMHALHAAGYAWRDMAVLLRASRNREPLVISALTEAGIPAVAERGENYTESAEIRLMISLLQLIDNPRQDIPLAAVLRSPLFAFRADELVEIRLCARDVSFFAALEAAAQGEHALAEKARAFLDQLAAWRRCAGEKRVSELLDTIYHESGFYHLLGAMPGGAERQANLRLLHDKAHQYEESSYAGLFRFIRLLEDGQALKVADGSAQLRSEQEDAVRVMTIHKSKGLEFPVVFLAGLNSQFNVTDEKNDVIFERSLGLGARAADRRRRVKYPTLSHHAVALRLHQQALAEELRVLYVAMTRARERLILTASLRGLDEAAAGWAEDLADLSPELPLPGYKLLAAKRPLDWIGPAMMRHPDASELRRRSGTELPLLAAESRWQLQIVDESEPVQPPLEKAQPSMAVSDDLLQTVAEVLRYQYPYIQHCNYAAKWSVSSLLRLGQTEDDGQAGISLSDPLAEEERRSAAGGAARGTVYHRVLELLDFAQTDAESLRRQIAAMQGKGLIAQDAAADQEQIAVQLERFFQSELGRRLCAAQQIRREMPFTCLLPLDDADNILVQGMLDAAFWWQDGWVLLDYKTGGHGKSDAELAALYREQLSYYRAAIERLWQAPVREVYLCMLDLGRNILLSPQQIADKLKAPSAASLQ